MLSSATILSEAELPSWLADLDAADALRGFAAAFEEAQERVPDPERR